MKDLSNPRIDSSDGLASPPGIRREVVDEMAPRLSRWRLSRDQADVPHMGR
ncbi:MAG: hypothetical protein KDA96_11215 [Planctomycetaceae bacterium]|nr:hypothetical protein [Planctomycetaceae bacterium]